MKEHKFKFYYSGKSHCENSEPHPPHEWGTGFYSHGTGQTLRSLCPGVEGPGMTILIERHHSGDARIGAFISGVVRYDTPENYRKILRRRIEERLRKDEKFLEGVAVKFDIK